MEKCFFNYCPLNDSNFLRKYKKTLPLKKYFKIFILDKYLFLMNLQKI